jgi:hypothetical protein
MDRSGALSAVREMDPRGGRYPGVRRRQTHFKQKGMGMEGFLIVVACMLGAATGVVRKRRGRGRTSRALVRVQVPGSARYDRGARSARGLGQ